MPHRGDYCLSLHKSSGPPQTFQKSRLAASLRLAAHRDFEILSGILRVRGCFRQCVATPHAAAGSPNDSACGIGTPCPLSRQRFLRHLSLQCGTSMMHPRWRMYVRISPHHIILRHHCLRVGGYASQFVLCTHPTRTNRGGFAAPISKLARKQPFRGAATRFQCHSEGGIAESHVKHAFRGV